MNKIKHNYQEQKFKLCTDLRTVSQGIMNEFNLVSYDYWEEKEKKDYNLCKLCSATREKNPNNSNSLIAQFL